MTIPQASRRNGSALILALWALLLLSAAVLAWLKFLDQSIAITGAANEGLEAKALAHSGIEAALHPAVTRLTPILQQQFDLRHAYQVQMTGEGGRIDLNWLFTGQPNPAKIEIFKRYLERRGLQLQERLRLVDCILDWLQPGNVPRLNGAKDEGDYHPPERGFFISVDELALVKGSAPLVSQPGWQDDFTVYTAGAVDLQSASRPVLVALPGVGDANADRFLRMRRGPDQMDGTQDDHIFKDVNEAISYLGLSGASAQAVSPYVFVDNPLTLVHLVSTGTVGKSVRRSEVVAKKAGLQPMILSWKEL